MLTTMSLHALFKEQESHRVERKRDSKNSADDIRKAICAFANDLPNSKEPGVIFVGQEDNLACANLNVDDDLLKYLASLRDDGKLQPFPVMRVSREEFDGCTVAVIVVEPSFNPPVRMDGRVWVRVGPRRAQASAQEERLLLEKRQWGNLPFDAHEVIGAAVDDLDMRRFELEFLPSVVPQDILAENHRPSSQKLSALRLIGKAGLPTNTGMLFLGKAVTDWISGAYIQFLRIDGTNLTDPIVDQKQISGSLLDQVKQIDELVTLNIKKNALVGANVRSESADYPEVALRQLIRNALMHRNYDSTNAPVRITWYEDRVEIQSPGGPYGQVTQQNFGIGGITDYRNPTIAGLMKDLGLVEKFGVGIAISRKAIEVNGNPPLEFDTNEQNVLALVRAKT